MQGPAFSRTFKLLATVMVLGSAAWLARLWWAGLLARTLGPQAAWFLAAEAILLWTWWEVLRSRTSVDTQALRQTWMWEKKMDLADLATARLIRVRGLEWLIAPRLYVRTLVGKFAVFYTADPRMTAEFERLIAELKDFRAMR